VRILPGLCFLVVTHFAELTDVCFRSFPALPAAGLLACDLSGKFDLPITDVT